MDYLLLVGGDPGGRCAGLILAAQEHDNASYTTRRQQAATPRHMSYLRSGKQAECDPLEALTHIVSPSAPQTTQPQDEYTDPEKIIPSSSLWRFWSWPQWAPSYIIYHTACLPITQHYIGAPPLCLQINLSRFWNGE